MRRWGSARRSGHQLSGECFLFVSRQRTRATVLFYDGKSWRREKTLKGYVLRGVCAEKAGVDIVGYLPVGNASIVRTGYGLSGPRSILLRGSAGSWEEQFLDDRVYPTGVSTMSFGQM